MDATEAHDLLALASEAALAAGDLLLARFQAGPEREISAKSTPTDLVSEADLASQRAIRELIGARRPDDGFLGEEDGADVAGSSGLQWVVDPLDGTINFLFGIPQWCVSVAVKDAQGAVAGVIWRRPTATDLLLKPLFQPALPTTRACAPRRVRSSRV